MPAGPLKLPSGFFLAAVGVAPPEMGKLTT